MVHQRILTAQEIASDEFQRKLRAANTANRDVYVSMNTMREGARGRTKADVDQIRHIYLDVDAGGKEALDKILKADGMPNPITCWRRPRASIRSCGRSRASTRTRPSGRCAIWRRPTARIRP